MRNAKRALYEIALWILASLIHVSLAGFLTYLSIQLMEDPPEKTSGPIFGAILISSTWGSRTSLEWTKTVFLQILQKFVLLLPGIGLMVIGATAVFYLGLDRKLVWMIWFISGWSVVALAFIPKINANNIVIHKFSIYLDLIVYPILTTVGSLIIWGLWHGYIRNLLSVDWIALCVALTATLLPLIVSIGLRRFRAKV